MPNVHDDDEETLDFADESGYLDEPEPGEPAGARDLAPTWEAALARHRWHAFTPIAACADATCIAAVAAPVTTADIRALAALAAASGDPAASGLCEQALAGQVVARARVVDLLLAGRRAGISYDLATIPRAMTYRLAGNSGTATATVTGGIRRGDGTDGHPRGETFRWADNDAGVLLKVTQAGLDNGDWWPEGAAPAGPGTMHVTVRDSRSETELGDGPFRPVTRPVTIPARCPQCGRPRGPVTGFNNSEDGVRWWTNVWRNECGHTDMYENVVAEATEIGWLGPATIH